MENGGTVSDDMLAKAGLTREEAEIMYGGSVGTGPSEKLSASDRKYYAGYVEELLKAGGTVSDDMLAKAGLTREEAEFLYRPQQQNNYYYYQTPAQNPNNTPANPGNVGGATNNKDSNLTGLFGNVLTVPGVTGSTNTAKPSAITLSPEQIKQAYNNAKANRAVK